MTFHCCSIMWKCQLVLSYSCRVIQILAIFVLKMTKFFPSPYKAWKKNLQCPKLAKNVKRPIIRDPRYICREVVRRAAAQQYNLEAKSNSSEYA